MSALPSSQVMGGLAACWRCGTLFPLLITVALTGCSRFLPEMTPYGAVDSPDQYRSLNGLGVQRKLWEAEGIKCLTPRMLSPKLERVDVIVLVGQNFDAPGRASRKWLEDWLAREEGRTVIYFGRDFNAKQFYRERTLDSTSSKVQADLRQALARRRARELRARVASLVEPTFCGWFLADPTKSPVVVDQFKGAWSKSLGNVEGTWPVRTQLLPPREEQRGDKPAWLAATASKLDPAETELESEPPSFERSTWNPGEYETLKDWNADFDDLLDSNVLLASSDGIPLVFRLSRDEWEGSQLLIVQNGAPFLNGTLTVPLHQNVCQQIIASCLPAKRLAFVEYSYSGLLISNVDGSDGNLAGLEMLTVWPLSAISMSAAVLGLIACAYLFPILGRPQRLSERSVSDFGLHVDALVRMLGAARDEMYAVTSIKKYFKQVRGESPPAWLDDLVNDPRQYHSPIQQPADSSAATTPAPVAEVGSDATLASHTKPTLTDKPLK